MMKKTFFEKVSFRSLFNKNRDGTISPTVPVSIVGVAGKFRRTDKIANLRLSDHSYIHDYEKRRLNIRRLADTVIVMSFS